MKSIVLCLAALLLFFNTCLAGIEFQLIDLGHCQPLGINNKGEVVGLHLYPNEDNEYYAFYWNRKTGFEELTPYGGRKNIAFEINDSGYIAGSVDWSGAIWNPAHAITYIFGSAAMGINSSNQVAQMPMHAINDFGIMVGNDAWDINNQNEIVGGMPAFLVKDGNTILLGDLGGPTLAFAINENEIVVGRDYNNGAFIWDKTNGIRSLNTLFDNDGSWLLAEPQDINEYNQIVGFGYKNNELHGFLLEPLGFNPTVVPEPLSISLLAIGLLGIKLKKQ